MKKLEVFCDGGARGNPGPAASAFVVNDDNGKEIGRGSKYLGIQTNNVAEYTSLLLFLEWLVENRGVYGAYDFIVHMDSQLVVRQITGEYKIKSKLLLPLAIKVKKTIMEYGFKFRFSHVLREGNKRADELVNEALDNVSF